MLEEELVYFLEISLNRVVFWFGGFFVYLYFRAFVCLYSRSFSKWFGLFTISLSEWIYIKSLFSRGLYVYGEI